MVCIPVSFFFINSAFACFLNDLNDRAVLVLLLRLFHAFAATLGSRCPAPWQINICAVQSFKPLLKFLEALRYSIETSQNDSLHYLKFNVSDGLKCFKDT